MLQQTMKLSDRILRMEESATIKMAQIARNLKAKGHQVISLSLGEPDFDTPQHIKDAAKKALDEGYTKYTPVPGLVELREAICTKFKRDNGLEYTADQIVVSNGAKQSIANLALSLLNDGDEVVVFAPFWVSYKEIIKMAGGVPVFVHGGIEQDFKVTGEQLKAAITPKTRMVLYSSPCNPTGSVYTKTELADLVSVLKDYPDITIVSDEIYEYINFTAEGHISIASFPEVFDQTVVVNGFSKGFAMTGWRLGYMAAPTWIAKACSKMQGQFTSGANAFGQKAAAYALTSDMSATNTMKVAFLKRRNLVLEKLKEIEGVGVNEPEGAFYVFPDVSSFFGKSKDGVTIHNADDLCMYLLETVHLAIVTGNAFGDPNCVRLSYAASEEELTEAIRRMKEALTGFE